MGSLLPNFLTRYSIEARVAPTALGLVPFYIFQYIYLRNIVTLEPFAVKVIGDISLSAIVLYGVLALLVRYPSKLFEDRLFKNKLYFPTTNFLLFVNDEYSDETKKRIRLKIESDFSISLPSKEEEAKDMKGARKMAKDVVSLIIRKVGDGQLVLQQNIAYGFTRNLWGASWIGLLFSVVLASVAYGKDLQVFNFGIGLLIVYILYLTFGQYIEKYFAENYARKLIEEYLNT